jgi:2-iminobutanoate/2-iminopropanoate deaminase
MSENRLKTVPEGARQHRTAGPYSPVLVVDARRLVVISGQVAVDPDGGPIGATIEAQTRAALDNCTMQLASAGATLADVFKVNVYLADLGDWARFNAVYEAILPAPLPVRTAVQAVLLPPFLVEIEMWAVKPEG